MPERPYEASHQLVPTVEYSWYISDPRMAACASRHACMRPSGSAALTACVPRTATAFTFLDPMTAPMPVRAAA